MASIRLTRKEAEYGPLPHVCMRCGSPTDDWVKKDLSWYPKWAWLGVLGGLLPLLILILVFTKRARLNAPLCSKHRGHWWKANLISILGLLAVVGYIFFMIVFADSRPRPSETTMTVVVVGFVVLLVAWLGTLIYFAATQIRAVKIDDYDVSLAGVSDVFADELDKMLDEEDYDDKYDIRRNGGKRRGGKPIEDRRRDRAEDDDLSPHRDRDDDRIQR